MNIIEKYDSKFQYASVFFNILIAAQFYISWAYPQVGNAPRVIEMATLMAFEFIMVHSGIAMSVAPKKYSLYVLFPVYGIFALVMSSSIEGHFILITYLVAIFNRMRFAFADAPIRFKVRNGLLSVIAIFTYFFGVMAVSILDTKIPVLGLTQKYMEQSNYAMHLNGTSGMFLEMPQTALCLGVLYYLTLAIFEFTLIGRSLTRLVKFVKHF